MVAFGPDYESINCYYEIIDVDGEVGVNPFAEVDPHRDGWHHHRGIPHPPISMIFPPEVEQTNRKA